MDFSVLTMELPRPDRIESPRTLFEIWLDIRTGLKTLLSGLSEEELNRRPEDGSWSPAQVADHLQSTQSQYGTLLHLVFSGKLGEKGNFPPLDCDAVEREYSRPGQFKNPANVEPDTFIERPILLKKLDKALNRVDKYLEGKGSEELRLYYFDHPLCGMISMLEWLWVLTLHERQHLNFLREKLERRSDGTNL